MARVFVIQEVPGRNILSAEAYGRLEICLPYQQIVLSADSSVRILKEKLSSFTNKDYLLLTGDPVAIGIATAIAARAAGGIVNFLKWDRQEARYYVVKATI